MASEIKFGTDGWRAIIAYDFTFETVSSVAQAISDYLHEQNQTHGIVVGYDTRFLSGQFARLVAEICSSNGLPVYLSHSFVPTPVLSYFVKKHSLSAGLMITASHNPPQYNGIKFKAKYGGPALVPMTRGIEGFYGKNKPARDINAIKKNLVIHVSGLQKSRVTLDKYKDDFKVKSKSAL